MGNCRPEAAGIAKHGVCLTLPHLFPPPVKSLRLSLRERPRVHDEVVSS